ncbi:MAG: hypothetical protein AAF222_13640 [Pseudomonadota bacterium]
MKNRLQTFVIARHAVLWAALASTPVMAWADAGTVLSLCLDTHLTPEERATRLEQRGWRDTGAAAEALATALTLTQLSAEKPENWERIYSQSTERASTTSFGTDGFLAAPGGQHAVFFTRDAAGLQTCLYLGGIVDTGPLVTALDGSILRTIGEVTRIRGDGVKSLITAHGMTEAGRNMFTPRLPYAMTFTVVLDRQPGDLP